MASKLEHSRLQHTGQTGRAGAILWVAVACIATLFALALALPWRPVQAVTIGYFDYSWMRVLHEAITHGRQFGRELIIPYGPLGFLATNIYDPHTYWMVMAVRCVMTLIVLRVLWDPARRFIRQPIAALIWMAAIIALMAPGITAADAEKGLGPRLLGGAEDHFFSISAIIALLAYFRVYDRRPRPGLIAMIILLAAGSLAKANFLMQGIVVIAAMTLGGLKNDRGRGKSGTGGPPASSPVSSNRERRLPSFRRLAFLIPILYLICLTLFYFSARQSASSVGPFLWGWFETTTGHMDAVTIPGVSVDVLAYCFIAILVLALVTIVEWKRLRRGMFIPTLALAALFALLYKHSFTRQDFAHATIAPMAALATAIFYLPIPCGMKTAGAFAGAMDSSDPGRADPVAPKGRSSPSRKNNGPSVRPGRHAPAPFVEKGASPGDESAPSRVRQGAGILIITLAAVVVWSSLLTFTGQGLDGYAWACVVRVGDSFAAAGEDLRSPSHLHQAWDADIATVREQNPLPVAKIIGPTDVYPHRQDILLDYGFDYDPRPAFSSLFATAPALAELNAGHLRDARAPQTILFDVEPVDQQFPALADGLSWPEILSRYDLIDSQEALLVLRRRPTPLSYQFAPLTTLTGELGHTLAIPATSAAPVWAKIHLHPRLAGKALATLYKPPLIEIDVRVRDGTEEHYRLLPALAEQGFLLSPLVRNRSAFSMLFSEYWRTYLGPSSVEQIRLLVVDGSRRLNYDSQYTVELQELRIDRLR